MSSNGRGARLTFVAPTREARITVSESLALCLVCAENTVTSCDLHVLVYQVTEPVWPQRPNGRSARAGVWTLRAGADQAIGADDSCCSARRVDDALRLAL